MSRDEQHTPHVAVGEKQILLFTETELRGLICDQRAPESSQRALDCLMLLQYLISDDGT